jgi:hypothetical protein
MSNNYGIPSGYDGWAKQGPPEPMASDDGPDYEPKLDLKICCNKCGEWYPESDPKSSFCYCSTCLPAIRAETLIDPPVSGGLF